MTFNIAKHVDTALQDDFDLKLIQAQKDLELESLKESERHYQETLKKLKSNKYGIYKLVPELSIVFKASLLLEAKIREELEKDRNRNYVLFLKYLVLEQKIKPLDIAFITVREIIQLIGNVKRCKFTYISIGRSICKALDHHIKFKNLRREQPVTARQIQFNGLNYRYGRSKTDANYRKAFKEFSTSGYPLENESIELGVWLFAAAYGTCGFFTKKTLRQKHKSVITLAYTNTTERFLTRFHDDLSGILIYHYPMIHPPVSRVSMTVGGYFTRFNNHPDFLFQYKDVHQRDFYKGRTYPNVFKACTSLQRIPYQVNPQIQQVLDHFWKLGGDRAGLPAREQPSYDCPWTKEDLDKLELKESEEYKRWRQKVSIDYTEWRRSVSKVSKLNLTAAYARKFLGQTIYFPWGVDFRSRYYPFCQHLSPQGEDWTRALLQFKDGKPISDDVEFNITGAKHYGLDKTSAEVKYNWVRDNHQMLMRIAEDPLECNEWEFADAPFRFLAWCFEYKRLHDNPRNFLNYVAHSRDGTCNGFQHISSLMLDEVGARATNVLDSEFPKDIYGKVLDNLRTILEQGSDICKRWAKVVDRKLVKRPVMTKPYDVTSRGMTDQVYEELVNARQKDPAKYDIGLERGELFLACIELTKKIDEAIYMTIPNCRQLLEFFHGCAMAVAGQDFPLIWETPCGWEVFQLYPKPHKQRVALTVGSYTLRYRVKTDKMEPQRIKQKRSIAPNYIHSIDAAHLNNLLLERGPMQIMPIHDDFGTHAEDVPKMQRLIRTTFRDIYQQDLLKKFKEDILRNSDESIELPELPQRGSLDINEVLKARNFFS